jgi:hypothetical protein
MGTGMLAGILLGLNPASVFRVERLFAIGFIALDQPFRESFDNGSQRIQRQTCCPRLLAKPFGDSGSNVRFEFLDLFFPTRL